jgi:uncharacterized protein
MAAPLLSAPAHPVHLDEPAADFPDTNFILLHAGQQAWFPIALDLARWKPNIYLELSLWQNQFLEDEPRFHRRLDRIRQAIGLDRVLFGSDCPGVSKVMPLTRWVRIFQDLPVSAARHGFEVTEGESTAMLGGTAGRLLRLPTT